ncbi:hypothetical protein M9Y10_012652 [Tritrichomonas musculus]|uniref:Uncharacterized protein n=1 Tax=Tritrichomonas musculus TaxID=1915356 RepID=A0ABR2IEA0_9EUKA
MKTTSENLLNINQLKIILHELHKFYTSDDEEEIVASIAIDAAAMKPTQSSKKSFVGIQVQPLDKNHKPEITQVVIKGNGRLDDDILNKTEDFVKAGNEEKFKFVFVATDGENKTNSLHKNIQSFLQDVSCIFDEEIEAMKQYGILPISDPLHLLKGMKKQYLKHFIQMTKKSNLINHKNEKDVFKLSNLYHEEVETSSSLSSMRDDLSLMLFNKENLYLLGTYGHLTNFAFQFILVLSI